MEFKKGFKITLTLKKSLFSFFIFFMLPITISLQGCAHSEVQREAENNVDMGYVNMENSMNSSGDSFSNAYQNTSQTTKGLLLGGVGGAVAGGLTSGVGALPGAAGGAILGGAYGAYIDHYTTGADKLENRHAKVFVLGDQAMIVLPSEHIFNNETPVILPSAYSTLNLVAQYIDRYPHTSVQVTAYTDVSMPKNVAIALTQEQANNIVKYLWGKTVNTRLLYAVGEGSSHLVSPPTSEDCGENNRIEITFEKLPA